MFFWSRLRSSSRSGMTRNRSHSRRVDLESLENRTLLTLLGVETDFPRIDFNNTGLTTYTASDRLFRVTADPLVFLDGDPSDPSTPPRPIIAPDSFELNVIVNSESGGLLDVSGVDGNDLVITGTIPGTGFSGELLTGEVVAMGFLDSEPNDLFDVVVEINGGQLAGLYPSTQIGISYISEGSTFVGGFDIDFTGGAKGMLGALVDPVEPTKIDVKVDFELAGLDAGDIVSDPFVEDGLRIFGRANGAPDDENRAMIFDSADPTGGDLDLGTPNEDFGGPGRGNGGQPGQVGQNDVALGNVLIISEDGDSGDPDDNLRGGELIFEFTKPVLFASIGILDIDGDEGNFVQAFDASGNLLAESPLLPLGNNSVQTIELKADEVSRLVVQFSSSGAVTDLHYCRFIDGDHDGLEEEDPQKFDGFVSKDIGHVESAGSFEVDGDKATLRAGGRDIWGHEDAFHYAYQTLNGDGAIVVRVDSLSDTDAWAKAGVMIRDSLGDDSQHAMMVVTPRRGAAFQYRSETGGASAHVGTSGEVPLFVKLERIGDLFVGSLSTDGTQFVEVGRTQIVMNPSVFIGLAATAHDDHAVTTARFSELSHDGEINPVPQPETIHIEAEDYESSSGAFQTYGGYIMAPTSQGRFTHEPPSGKKVTYTFEAGQTGTYKISGLVRGRDGSRNSFWFGLRDSEGDVVGDQVWIDWHVDRSNRWVTNDVTKGPERQVQTFELVAGQTYTIQIKVRESGTKLDKLTITNDLHE